MKIFGCLIISLSLFISCGSEVIEAKQMESNSTLNLKEYGLDANIQIQDASVEVLDNEAKYEQKILPNKRIEIKAKENIMLVITECQENGVEMKVEFAEGFGETIIEKGEDYCIIEQEGDNGEPVYDVSLFIEKDNAFIEVKVCDPVSKAQCPSIELAKSGLEIARTFKFS